MARAGVVAVSDGVATEIFRDPNGCTSFSITADADIEVNIPGLHHDDWLPMAADVLQVFRLNNLGIKHVFVRGNGGAANVSFGVVAIDDSH